MRFTFSRLLSAGLLLALFGCSTSPKKTYMAPAPAAAKSSDGTSTAPARTPEAALGTVPSGATSDPTPAKTASTIAPLPQGEYAILVESVPSGGTVVVNGIPIGKAPQRILMPGTARGFFRDQVSLKVRFLATDAVQTSQTVEELLTPLDRIPAVVRFTPRGATRASR